jgi:hypothetical protein
VRRAMLSGSMHFAALLAAAHAVGIEAAIVPRYEPPVPMNPPDPSQPRRAAVRDRKRPDCCGIPSRYGAGQRRRKGSPC